MSASSQGAASCRSDMPSLRTFPPSEVASGTGIGGGPVGGERGGERERGRRERATGCRERTVSQAHLHIRSGDPIFSSAVSWQMKQASSFWKQAGASSTSLSSGRGAISDGTFARATELDTWTSFRTYRVCEPPIKMNRGEITKRDRENPFGRTADGRASEGPHTKFRSDRPPIPSMDGWNRAQ